MRVGTRGREGRPLHLNHRIEHHAPPTAEEDVVALRARLETHEQALQIGGMGIWEWDPQCDDLRCSRHLAQLMGHPAGAFAGRLDAFLVNVHPDDAGHVAGHLRQAPDGEQHHRRDVDIEFRVLGGDGAERWMRSTGLVVRDEEGRPTRVIGSQVDITEHKASQLRLRESAALLEYVLDTSPIVLFAGVVEDDEYLPTYASGNSERVQGWSAEAFLSGAVRWKELLHPDDAAHVTAANERALREGHSEWECRLRRPDGTYGASRTMLRVSRHADGRRSYVGCTLDVTESHEMEQLLRQGQKLEAVGQLAGGVAHDFNNLLQAITGYTGLARQASMNGGPADLALVEVERASGHAIALVQQLLTFSRREELRPVAIDVGVTVDGMRELLTTTAGDQVRLSLFIGARLGSVRLGQGQFEQLLLNLVVNARDAMPDGGDLSIAVDPVDLEEAAASTQALEAGSYVRLVVADSGHGMTPDVRAHAMEPFFTTKPVGSGTGLGLATIYGIVSKAGGCIDITSAPGAGTTVAVLLPRYVPTEEESEDQAPGGQAPRKETAEPDVGPAGPLLLVEDEPQVRALLASALARLGHHVLTAADGAEALALVEGGAPQVDLLITDVVMPGMNGIELAHRLRERRPDLRVLFMSGYTGVAGDLPGTAGEGFLQKPFSMQELQGVVSRILAS